MPLYQIGDLSVIFRWGLNFVVQKKASGRCEYTFDALSLSRLCRMISHRFHGFIVRFSYGVLDVR